MPVGSELLAQAQAAPEEAPRSKLENYCAAIFELRRKRWSYEKIAHWLKERGVEAVPSSIFRFCRVRQHAGARPPATAAPPEPAPAPPAPTSPTETKPKRKYHFNLDI
jgi:IS30 family transposase